MDDRVRRKLAMILAAWAIGACAASAAAAQPRDDAPPGLRAACMATSAPGVTLPSVDVHAVPAAPGDLPYYQADSRVTGAHVRIYHAPDLADAAASRAACLMGLLDRLASVTPPRPSGWTWSPLVLTHDAGYIPPRRDGEVRWKTVFASRAWDAETLNFLTVTLPHEEVHLVQSAYGDQWPRWFAEGHAEWAGLQVTETVDPARAGAERDRRAADRRALGPAPLGAWGGLRVKPAAIQRQLSAQDRARQIKEPSYQPSGPFTFGPGDFVEDNDNETGRYGAALALFSDLEARHGNAAVQAWVEAVLESHAPDRIVPLARHILGEDIAPLLK